MDDEYDIIAGWIAREIVPHEAAIRRWLTRRWGHVVDAEDVIQEAYCRIAGLASVDHIASPAGYFHQTVHAVANDLTRRAGIINFTSMTQIEWSNVMDDEPSIDQAMEASQELARVRELLAALPDTCRSVIELRRVEGLSRKETAERLGVSENDVKNHLVRGLQKVMKTMAEQDAHPASGAAGSKSQRADAGKKAEQIGKQRPH
ncbi:sigma-70 family RNA polymerase sigma factor [Altererythrobacter xixiisoli]|uniref:Sigma-70 family RNA polymerase sigma factor n=1 Tax=Croceibacterium xixiisoli TaxID=1476466 RepID=A0A6I4U172_9SPHN|nr:RNA polymerase sigma factor [Croceibacterium xixiisoli]MXP00688.1 sigma-70 family RNA polymerase sigma factor [Croceibacterium xixiisoli]